MNKEEYKKYLESLPPGVREDALKGGKTQSPMGDLAILGATAAAVKGAPLMIGGAKNLLKNEVAKMTISDAAFKKGLLPELTKGGIKNWQHLRPWKAFTPQMLKTGPTPGAAAALGIGAFAAGSPAQGRVHSSNKEGNVDEVWDLTGPREQGPMPKSFYDKIDKIRQSLPIKKAGIDPESIPGRVLRDRQQNPGKLGSRSNPHPPGTPPHVLAGMTEAEFNALPEKDKKWFID